MQAGVHRVLWVSEADAKFLRDLLLKRPKRGDVRALFDRIGDVLAGFHDAAVRLQELEVTCRANAFWLDGPKKSTRVARIVTKDEAKAQAVTLRKKLERAGRVKPLRGGLER